MYVEFSSEDYLVDQKLRFHQNGWMKRFLILVAAAALASCSPSPREVRHSDGSVAQGLYTARGAARDMRTNPQTWTVDVQAGTAYKDSTYVYGLNRRTTVRVCRIDRPTDAIVDCRRPSSKARRRVFRAYRAMYL